MTERVSIFIDQQTLEAKIAEVAAQINKDYAGRSIHLICILKGGREEGRVPENLCL